MRGKRRCHADAAILIFSNERKRDPSHGRFAPRSGPWSIPKAAVEGFGTQEREPLLRAYAAGEISWRELRQRGFADYVDVLTGLGEIGLRPPMAPMEGPSLSARERGRALLRRLLQEAAQS